MKRVFLNDDASILSVLEGNLDLINLNTPKDAIFIDDIEYISNTDYFDSEAIKFVSIGESPSNHHTFDYTVKQWIDPRTLDEIKTQKWTEIKAYRDQLEFGGFEFEGNIYDSDQVSQGRIMGAAAAGIDQTWTLANNTTVELTALQLQQLYGALQAHVASVHERGRMARLAIESAETVEEVESIQL